jgi:hypothetical protein
MGIVCRTVRFVVVVLTAGMTLLTGIPHFDCVCPNGQHKPFCLSLSSANGCCCGGACCSGSEGHKCCCSRSSDSLNGPDTKQHSCCEQEQFQYEDTAPAPAQFQKACCTRTLAENVFLAVAPTEPTSLIHPLTGPVFFLPTPALTVPVALAHSGANWLSWPNFHSPPTDLVVAFKHFLI